VRIALVPDEVVAARGRQLGFWGGETAADERASRALARVQTLLGADAVRVPEWRGGRNPHDQIALVPAAAVDLTARRLDPAPRTPDGAPPWPGRLPSPSPAVVLPERRPVDVVDAHGRTVAVNGRGLLGAAPAALAVDSGRHVAVTAWAGPWLLEERWWDGDRGRRAARLQVCTDDGVARLVTLESGQWWVEAVYD
jgi:protein ImuB